MTDWDRLEAQGRYGAIAAQLIADTDAFDWDALAADPRGVLNRYAGIRIEILDGMNDRCAGGGYYRPTPPTIYLYPASRRRDNFTLLHELGHHIQQNHPEWGFILLDKKDHQTRILIEEAVSDEIAAQILIPGGGTTLDARESHPADVMAGAFATSQASRSAALKHVRGLLPDNARWILAVADTAGRVQHSETTYADLPPAKGSLQPGFATLAEEARDGPVRRVFHENVQYRDGSRLDDMRAEAVLDDDGRYVFVALTPTARFGTGKHYWPQYECANPVCERTFTAKAVRRYCDRCGEPCCPGCGRCSCEISSPQKYCPECFMPLTQGEIETNSHECG